MLKKLMMVTALLVGLGMTPLTAKSSWNYTGHITALNGTSITVFDQQYKEHLTLAFDDHTSFTHWIREKPYVRKTQYLTPTALKFGGLVRVRMRDGDRMADAIEVASDVKTTFSGRIKAFDDTSVSVYNNDMDVVTLTYGHDTAFRELFTVKPWIRPAVRLSTSDLKVGARAILFSSAPGSLTAERVDIAREQAFATPVQATPKANTADLLTSAEARALIATANTPADHVKLQKHFLALAAKYDAEAVEHAAEAAAYHKNPNPWERKGSAGPGTSVHCERLAELDREKAKETRDLASAHEHMAAAAK
jgi:hypothetical protein